jgi:RNA polymerase sigma-70 factor (ECF subfamily)
MDRLAVFNQHRSPLFAIAYRMLGSVSDAEDIVQEAWLRWQTTETVVHSPKAFLSSLVTRLCIDHLRSARVKREQYVGTWLPEPLLTEQMADSKDAAELSESLSIAFLMLLECLSPTERAVFLLREAFDYDYVDIARIVNKSVSNCRQIVRRARQHLVLRRPTINPSVQQKAAIVEQFLTSWNQGDVQGLVALLAEDVTYWGDGGGQAVTALKPLHGRPKVAHVLVVIRHRRLPTLTSRIVQVNGQPGIINFLDGQLHSVLSFELVDDCIRSIFAVVNPEKLKAVKPYVDCVT